MVKHWIRWALLSSVALPAQAQQLPKWNVSVGYFGEQLSHPGLVLGVQRLVLNDGQHQIFVGAQLGGYVHQRNQTGVFVGLESGCRLLTRSGFFVEQSLGLGYLRTYLHGGDVFEVDAARGAHEVKDGGRGHLMPSVSFGPGWVLRRQGQPCGSVFARPVIFWQFPFNNYALVHLAAVAGVSLYLPAQKP